MTASKYWPNYKIVKNVLHKTIRKIIIYLEAGLWMKKASQLLKQI
jgi:hypothetical protein